MKSDSIHDLIRRISHDNGFGLKNNALYLLEMDGLEPHEKGTEEAFYEARKRKKFEPHHIKQFRSAIECNDSFKSTKEAEYVIKYLERFQIKWDDAEEYIKYETFVGLMKIFFPKHIEP